MSLENGSFLVDEQKKEKSVLYQNHEIKLEFGEGAIEFSESHKKKIMEVLNHYNEIDPELIKNFSKFESTNASGVLYYKTFPGNARIIHGDGDKWGIEFFNAGMDIKKPHRISSSENLDEDGFVDNFSGTLAHEITHGGTHVKIFSDKEFNQNFIREWWKKFGWGYVHPIIKNTITNRPEQSKEPTIGWEKNENGKWQKGDYNIMKEEYTTMPEACIGGKDGYAARVDMNEDVCDSVAAYLLNPSILDKGKCEFIKNKISEYKKVKTIQ
ncbi:MAG: hypothetical protein WA063_03380 [Minisyncoccia bacterium]